MTLLQAILCGLVAVYGVFDFALGSLYLNRPIFLSAITGLILGDFQTGIIIGATLELFFMGAVSVGAYIPPDVVVGGVVATALAIVNGYSTEIAIALAMPIALFSLAIGNLITITQPFFLKRADYYADKCDAKGVVRIQWTMALINCARRFILTFLALYFGATAVEAFVAAIPDWVISGMSAAGGLMPAMGFAMLMRMILTKQILPYYFLGFVLAAYLAMPSLGVAILAVIIVMVKFDFLNPNRSETGEMVNSSTSGGGIDDDF